MALLLLVPTRGRPQNAVALLESFRNTATLGDSVCLFLVDEDDEQLDSYLESLPPENVEVNEAIGSMVAALNASATLHAAINVYNYLGFMGDDHRPRTLGWDKIFTDQLASVGGGFVYGNDLFQGMSLPTHIVMNTSIVGALGWMSPPNLKHLYVDDSWLYLGDAVGRLYYFEDVVIEHMHPMVGKSAMDSGYERVNDPGMYHADRGAFEAWKTNSAAKDIETVRRILL